MVYSAEAGGERERNLAFINIIISFFINAVSFFFLKVCVGMRRCSDEAGGELERNVASLQLTEGLDLWYFV